MTNDRTNHAGDLAERLVALVWRKPADGVAERTRRRVVIHLIPWLFFLYILAYLDRVNIGVAKFGMAQSPAEGGLGFTEDVIGRGMGIFFWGYWILEVPSTVSVVRWGARWVFVRILILWGLCTALVGGAGTPFVSSLFAWMPQLAEHSGFIHAVDGAFQGLFGWIGHLVGGSGELAPIAGFVHFLNRLPDSPKNQFYFLRFMLGFFEGGFFPSVIVYLTLWFRPLDRAKAIAVFMSAIPVSNVLGMPLSGLILEVHWLSLPGWRWIFIIQGITPILAGIATLFFLPDRPQKASWLPREERDWLVGELEREAQTKTGHGHWIWVHHLGMVLLLTAVYFGINLTSYGLAGFMPSIIKDQSGASSKWASILAALPYVLSLLGMLFNGRHSDRTGERIWHVAIPLSLWSLALCLAAWVDGWHVLAVLVMIVCVGPFLHAHLPAFWPIPTMFLGATVAASAIGFINMIGNLGGSVGLELVGRIRAAHPESNVPALLALAPYPVTAAIIVLAVGYFRRQRAAK